VCGGALLYDLLLHKPAPQAVIVAGKDPGADSAKPKEPSFSNMPVKPGHLGNLTPDQEAKLRKFWTVTLKTFGVEDPSQPNGTAAEQTDTASELDTSTPKDDDRKKKRMSIFRKHKEKDVDSGSSTPTKDPSKSPDSEDKYGQMKEFHEILATQSPESLRAAFWAMVKSDHPDALLLRFLRARKWDVDRALVMLISTMRWRARDMHVDDDVIKHGEGGALEDSMSESVSLRKDGDDFLQQLRLGKSFLHGVDKEGRPLCIVRVRLHKGGEQSEKSLERYTVYIIETARLVLRTPVETAVSKDKCILSQLSQANLEQCIVFDMTHFTMANMDYAPVKFMIKVFEANYPESLGAVLVHKAPWIFQGIWTIIKGWLDPVVASKVHFTKNAEDLEQFIPKSQILKELGGDEEWEYQYIEPVPGENDLMREEAPRIKLQEERRVDVLKFQKKTFDWIHVPMGTSAEGIKKERDELAEQLNRNYWALDPYIRARTLYDRQGMIGTGGKINFYPPQMAGKSAPVVNGEILPMQAASADDVD
jgi:CRAL/TRIO domain/CRAL/TRIO, N-terminal domain